MPPPATAGGGMFFLGIKARVARIHASYAYRTPHNAGRSAEPQMNAGFVLSFPRRWESTSPGWSNRSGRKGSQRGCSRRISTGN